MIVSCYREIIEVSRRNIKNESKEIQRKKRDKRKKKEVKL